MIYVVVKERVIVVRFDGDLINLFGEIYLFDYYMCGVGDLLEIIGCVCGDVFSVEDEFFGDAIIYGDSYLVFKVCVRV